ncbi:YHYH domain-containing protein [Neobacillus sp. NPDC097160]|uniref:YHYH domain-containing protein n=1 Tax=Neobacillus sp. NPDC097160 TaxID=3364298 RepID=UPI003801C7BC
MNKKVAIFTLLLTLLFGTFVSAHSGRTDSSGGHNCSEKSKSKGLCAGYHYHNGGGTSTGGSTEDSTPINTDKDCSDFATYDEMIQYWNSKGYSATYDPENLDGWGNGMVDDGIPCEAPSGYDKTLINNSPEQAAHRKEEYDNSTGEKEGYPAGLKDGYQETPSNSNHSVGTEAYKVGYAVGYLKGYDEGKKKIDGEKTKAINDGYAFGKEHDKIVIPAVNAAHPSLNKAFEEGFNKAITERVEAKKKEYTDLGYSDGKKNMKNTLKNIEEIYAKAYQEGYEKAQTELKEEYLQKGYEAAFINLEYLNPNETNEKFAGWIKEGFESNKEIAKIKEAGYALGKEGRELKIPSKYKKGEVIFKHHYELGLKLYEKQQSTNRKAASGGIGAVALGWLGRRLYVAKKMIS